MAQTDLQVVAPQPARHRDGIFDLVAKVFSSGPGYYAQRDRCADWYINHSHYDWDASRIGVDGERIVTHYGVWSYDMRIGRARVKTGGIGVVATDGDYRKQGLMAKTVPHSIEAMRQLGYDMTVLFGISDFYDRFGYVRAWSDSHWTVRTSDLPQARPEARPQRFAPRPGGEIEALFNHANARMTGTAVRPTYRRKLRPGNGTEGLLWRDDGGRVAGYVMYARSSARLDCREAAGDAEQVLCVLSELARKWHCAEVRFDTLPYTSDLARRLRTMTSRHEVHYHRCGGPMVRTINLPQCLSKMSVELEARLKESPLSDWRGQLTIADAWEQATLEVSDGKISVSAGGRSRDAVRGGPEIAQLLIGTADPMETIEAAGTRLSGEARRLVPVLFPNQYPQLHMADRY